MPCKDRWPTRREAGSALFLAVMMLALMGFLGIAALDRVTRDEQVAGYQNRSRNALYAAEAGLADAHNLLTKESLTNGVGPDHVPTFTPSPGTPQTVGDTTLYDREGGELPRYYGDPTPVKGAIRWAWTSTKTNGSDLGKPRPGMFWISVIGESADGSQAHIDALVSESVDAAGGGGSTGTTYQ